MNNHMTKKHATIVGVEPVDQQTVIPIQKEKCPTLAKRDNYDDESDDESDKEDEAYQESHFDPPDNSSVILDIDYQESFEILANLFSSFFFFSLDCQNYPGFSNQTSDTPRSWLWVYRNTSKVSWWKS